VCYIWGVYYAGSYTLEQDAAWHQVIIRDTSFTASHIVAFYGTFPLYITCGVSSYLYAQTRLPLYSQATSFPLVAAVVGEEEEEVVVVVVAEQKSRLPHQEVKEVVVRQARPLIRELEVDARQMLALVSIKVSMVPKLP
jgi:hypothetical protein